MSEVIRYKGTETEAGLIPRNVRDTPYCASKMIEHGSAFAHNKRPEDDIGITKNGGRLYLDFGDHPEYSTPDCLEVEDAVLQEMIGENFLIRAFTRANSETQKLRGEIDTPMFGVLTKKNTVDSATYGAHENYQVLRSKFKDLFEDEIWQSIAAHLISRVVYTGSGGYLDGSYYISPRSQRHVGTVSNAEVANRPLVHVRDEPLVQDEKQWRRLHVTTADANMSPWAIHMRLGTTSQHVRAMEHGMRFDDLCPRDPVKAFWLFGGGSTRGTFRGPDDPIATLSEGVVCNDGQRRNALQIQREIELRTATFDDSDSDQLITEERQRALAALEGLRTGEVAWDLLDRRDDTSQFLKSIDWTHRLAIIASKGHKVPPEKIDRLYDKLTDDTERGGIAQKRRESEEYRLTPDDWSLDSAASAPSSPRARLRGITRTRLAEVDTPRNPTITKWTYYRTSPEGERHYLPDFPTEQQSAEYLQELERNIETQRRANAA